MKPSKTNPKARTATKKKKAAVRNAPTIAAAERSQLLFEMNSLRSQMQRLERIVCQLLPVANDLDEAELKQILEKHKNHPPKRSPILDLLDELERGAVGA